MEKTIVDRIKESLDILENFFGNNHEAQKIIEDLIVVNFQDDSLMGAFEGIEVMYGEDISNSISRILSFPTRALEIIQDGTYSFESFYKLFIIKFRSQFLRLRQFEENGRTTLMKLSEDIIENVFNYSIQRADNTYIEFKVSHENQIGIINYLINVLNKHISNSNTLDLEDLEDFSDDLPELKKYVNELESNLSKKLEEMNNGKNQG